MRPGNPVILILLMGIPCVLSAVLPLRDQWGAACRALAIGEADRAYALLEDFEHWYGGEEIAREAAFRETRLRLRALAALQAGKLAEASRHMKAWLVEHPGESAFRAWFLFNLAELEAHLGRPQEAEVHRSAFLEENPGLPEGILVHWSRADEAVREGELEAALGHLRHIPEHPALPESGKALVASATASLHLASGKAADAFRVLSADVPESGAELLALWRAAIAPSIVPKLIEDQANEEAMTASAWFALPDLLRKRFQDFITPLQAAGGAQGVRQSLWNVRWTAQLNRMQASLDRVLEGDWDSDTLYRLRLRTLLSGAKHRDAVVLGRALRLKEAAISDQLRMSAYRGEIEGLLALGETERARRVANLFIKAYPEDEGLPAIRFLLARTAAREKEWESALAQIADLLKASTGHVREAEWKLVQANWLLEAGRAEEALAAYREQEGSIPERWLPYLRFQSARCHEALRESGSAIELFREVIQHGASSWALRENACTALLKRLLADGRLPGFHDTLRVYETEFSEGLNRLMVKNMAAAAQLRLGNTERAVRLYEQVAAKAHPASRFARRHLSRIYRREKDFAGLEGHALRCIRQGFQLDRDIPPEAFMDALTVQQERGCPVLPESLLLDLLDSFAEDRRPLPPASFFSLLGDKWQAYSCLLNAGGLDFDNWLEDRASRHLRHNHLRAWACFQLALAERASQHGRHDSADTHLIRTVRTLPPELANREMLFRMAETAARYDFPEAELLLERFLQRFSNATGTARVLECLAPLYRRSGRPESAERLLRELVRAWPDQPEAIRAGLRLAEWRLAAGDARACFERVRELAANPSLTPRQTARALALRTRAAIGLGYADKAILSAVRLLTLYPEFGDILNTIEREMEIFLETLPEGPEQSAMKDTFQTARSANRLHEIPAQT